MSSVYESAGVSITKAAALVESLKRSLPHIGGFNGIIELPPGYKQPLLISGADGVGTKINQGGFDTIGIDLVAMCVNDVITSGAKPLYFLDYISTPCINSTVETIINSIRVGCDIANIPLIGGETAEHGDGVGYDLAGFCVGIIEKDKLITGEHIKPGCIILGIESSGLHSNGFSIINKYNIKVPLTPTYIYSPIIQNILDHNLPILGMAHITGGGLPHNLPRCVSKDLSIDIDYNSWGPWDPIYDTIISQTGMNEHELKQVFNLGIGFCLIIDPQHLNDIQQLIPLKSYPIGRIS